MEQRLRCIAASLLICGTLSACGKTADDSGSLSSKADVLREIGQFGRFLDVSAPLYGSDTAQGGPAFYWGSGNPPRRDCASGSVNVVEGSARAEFEYFSTAETADYSVYRFDACRFADDADASVSYVQAGQLELGRLRGYDPMDLADTLYTYAGYGDQPDNYTYARDVRDAAGNLAEQVVEQIAGRVERASGDIPPETRAVVSRTITRTVPDGYTLSWQQGTSADPLRSRVISFGGPRGGASYSVRGPIAYESSRCAGGVRRIDIPDGVTVIEGTLSSGTLNLTLANETLTLEFDAEGAIATFADRSSARLPRVEIAAERGDPQC